MITTKSRRFPLFLHLGLFGLVTASLMGCIEDESSPIEDDAETEEMRSGSLTPELLGQWTFEPGAELVDATGRWGQLVLAGNASVSNGQLHVHGSGTTATGWAVAQGYTGAKIREKTLMSWVAVDDLSVRSGSAMTIDTIGGAFVFDAITYAEIAAYRWMAGSEWYWRTLQNLVTPNETAVGQMLQMAISYRDLGNGSVEITLCRNGVQIGRYTSSSMAEWMGANAEVVFGARYTNPTTGARGALEGRIEEARIYGGAMTCAQIGAVPLKSDGDADGVPDEADKCEGFADHLDGDGDGIADGCDVCRGDNDTLDGDGDGVCGNLDLCLGDDQSGDADGDQVCDAIDNCATVANTEQSDADADGRGDACDDEDNDGVLDLDDNCKSVANPDQADSDADAAGDVCDPDDDNDTVADGTDNCALVANPDQLDSDLDLHGDACDGDDDNDLVVDQDDLCPGTPAGVAYNEDGCTGVQYVARSCGLCKHYPNEGQYQKCVAQASQQAVKDELLTNKERAGIVSGAAKASCQ